jgi:serine protease inhibitor
MVMAMVSFADNEPKNISLTADEWQLVKSNNDFAFNLFRTARTEKSQILSPLSITYALGMLNNGASGETLKQINTVLGFGDAGAEGINAFCRKMLTEAPNLDEQTKVMIANTIYVNEGLGYVLKDEFVNKVKQYYDAEPESRDFADGKTLDVINQWASDHTEGMIKKILKKNQFDESKVSYLLNALYFKGTWTLKFDESKTEYEEFNDELFLLPMMHQEEEFYYTDNDEYQALTLPYGNGAYQMTILLPREGKTVNEVLQGLTAEKWQQSYQRMDMATVDVKLPRFESMTDIDLKEVMAKLGMPDAFDPILADFPDFCNAQVYISLMKQVAKIKVNEEGTEASAVTVIGVDEKSASEPRHVNFHANRPFLYVISERSTGSIFFIGQFMGDMDMNPQGTISLTADEKQLVKQNNDFALNLFRETRTEENLILSPLSITCALGMLNNAAAGLTQQEINNVLGFGDAGAEAINTFCRKMLYGCPDLDAETKAMISNAIYVNEGLGYVLKDEFVNKVKLYYDAKPESRDFADGKTLDVINEWASDHTEGMIKEILDVSTFNSYAVSYLLNAIYFKGIWANKFDKAETKDEAFEHAGPDKYLLEVPMMHQYGEFKYTDNDTYQAIKLPYGNGAYQMTVFLPREGKTINDVLGLLDGENWQIKGGGCDVDLKLPRIETETEVILNPIMAALGMPMAFSPQAEFPYFCNSDIYINMMRQKAKIKLDEEGTEAAAVTIIELASSDIHGHDEAVFHANRPFLYMISEQSTGAIFFIGQYTGLSEGQFQDAILSHTTSPSDSTEIYNLQGQRLSTPPAKGIYIRNGKIMSVAVERSGK